MKTIFSCFVLFLLSTAGLFAQQPPKSKAVFFPITYEKDDFKIVVEDIVATSDYTKLKLKIQNKTGDFFIFEGSQAQFIFQGGVPISPGEKPVMIKPFETESKVIDVKCGSAGLVSAQFDFIVKGLYRIIPYADLVVAPDFKLPATQHIFTAGPFQITHNPKKAVKKTSLTEANFAVQYTGSKMGLVNPVKALCKLENGQSYGISNTGVKQCVLAPGESCEFSLKWTIPAHIVDMQFANMLIVWNETFREADKKLMSSPYLVLKRDAANSE